MHFNKIILIGILLMCVPSVLAWDSETGYAEGEEIETEFIEGYNYFTYTTPDKPIRITSYLITDEEIEVTVTTTCLKWDGDSYEVDTDTLPEEYGMTLDIQANQTGTTNIKIDPVEEFFKNNTNAVEDFTTRDDDSEHPDVLNVTIDITGTGMDVHETGYTTLNDAALDNVKDSIETPDDYGFATLKIVSKRLMIMVSLQMVEVATQAVAASIQVLTFIVVKVMGLRKVLVTFLNNSFIFVFLFYL
jgi:hypothetical protein